VAHQCQPRGRGSAARAEKPPFTFAISRCAKVPRLLFKNRARKQRPIHHPSHRFWHADAMGDLLGYARVSTTEQKAHLQTDALKKAGCIRVWTDKASGSLDHRPKLEAVLDHLRPGDTLVVWRLDRLGRNLRHLIATVNDLAAAGVGFKSLTEGIDTTTPAGRLTFYLFGALAEFERELIRERTTAGLAAARARGRSGGRPRVMTPEKLAVARQMYDSRGHTLAAIGAVVGVSRSTLYRYLGDQGRPGLSSLKGREETGTNRVGPRRPTGKRLPDTAVTRQSGQGPRSVRFKD
jgi:DNA invertase Pin-like site-specific DNA recombinase